MDNKYKKFSGFQLGFFSWLVNPSMKEDRLKSLNQTHKQEAEKNGLELLSRSNSINYNLYRHLKCNHTAFYQSTHVRRGNIQCKTCLLFKYANDANNNNYAFLHTTKNSRQLYLKPCGHIIDSTNQNIRKSSSTKCSECFEETLHKTANANGYIYKGVAEVGSASRLIEFKSCGHEKVLQHSQVFKGNAVCRICESIQRKELAAACGLTELNEVGGRYFEYLLPCRHTKILRADHAIDGSYICDFCGDSHYQRPSNLYLFEFSSQKFSWLKLGFSSNLYLRKNNYGLPPDTKCELIINVAFETGREAMLIEKELHRDLKTFRLNKEIMKSYHTNNGYSECYNITMKDEIIKKIKEVCFE